MKLSKYHGFETKIGFIKSIRVSVSWWSMIVILIITCKTAEGQIIIPEDSISPIRIISMNPRVFKSHDTIYVYSGICKTLKITKFTGQRALSFIDQNAKYKPPLFSIHGNIQYDFLYRSFADTPFYQKDFRQHTLQTSLTVIIKDKYPLHVNMVVRKSNSPFFKDFFDGGISFDRFSYYKNIKQRLLTRIVKQLPEQPYLDAAKKLLEKEIEKYNVLKNRLNTFSLSQQLIEERERIYFQLMQLPSANLPGKRNMDIDTLADNLSGQFKEKKKDADTLAENLSRQVNEKRKELDSLQNNISRLRRQVDSMKNKIAGNIALARQKINKATNPKEFSKVLSEYGLEEKKEKSEKFIADLKTIGIGRTILNYSELTARNVSLTGLNFEYNPRLYAAVAAGKLDYGFRDFFGRNTRSLNQHLLMGRLGVGDIEKRAIIFSVYTGRKANYGSFLSDTVKSNIQVTGFSIETIVKKDKNTQFSAEIAKSTQPVTGRYADNKELGSLFRFSDNTNLGISLKGQTIIRETETRLSGFFRKTGENFQSFSLFSYNTDQTAWMMKVDQSFFKDKMSFTGTLRRNDFVNPFTEKTFKTTTVFASVQLSARIPKWPSVSIGYHPGSQLYIIDRNRIRENVYYILNGSLVYQYMLSGLRMVSSAIYNNYTARGTDSGFINYSGTNYMLSQFISFRKLQLQGNFIYTDQQELKFYTLESSADCSITTMLRLGAGIKYNRVIDGNIYWGGTGQLMLDIKKIGSLQLQYEKSFLPTIQQTLFPVEIGRVTLFKNF